MAIDADIYQNILRWQRFKLRKQAEGPLPHRPRVLYIGCSDARLDPVTDIGIPQGEALIYRNIGGRVPAPPDLSTLDMDAAARTGQIPEAVSMGATLEFFLNHVEDPENGEGRPPQTKHIIVSAHTYCGGVATANRNGAKPKDQYLPYYLAAMLAPIREFVGGLTGSHEEKDRATEEESVRASMKHLRMYEVVREAENAVPPRVVLHGWVLGTDERRDIRELDEVTNTFHPLVERGQGAGGVGGGGPQ